LTIFSSVLVISSPLEEIITKPTASLLVIILTNNSIIKDKHLDIAKKIESILLEHLTIPSKFQN